MKTRMSNDLTDHMRMIYTENKIELSWSIGLGVIFYKNRQDNDVIDHTRAAYAEKKLNYHDQSY